MGPRLRGGEETGQSYLIRYFIDLALSPFVSLPHFFGAIKPNEQPEGTVGLDTAAVGRATQPTSAPPPPHPRRLRRVFWTATAEPLAKTRQK